MLPRARQPTRQGKRRRAVPHQCRHGGAPDRTGLRWLPRRPCGHPASGKRAGRPRLHGSRRRRIHPLRLRPAMKSMAPMNAGDNPAGVAAKAAPPPCGWLRKAESSRCCDCRCETRAQMNQMSHHPVLDGRMKRPSRHDAPGGSDDHLARPAEPARAFSTKCHPFQLGPFVSERAAVEEGCQTCDTPHGVVARRLPPQAEPLLCQQRLEGRFHPGRAGVAKAVQPAAGAAPIGTGGTAGRRPTAHAAATATARFMAATCGRCRTRAEARGAGSIMGCERVHQASRPLHRRRSAAVVGAGRGAVRAGRHLHGNARAGQNRPDGLHE